jgi:hypothetical protein
MATELFANQPLTTVSSGGTDAPSPGTSQTWTVASSSPFPAAATGTSQFHVCDTAAGKTGEIIAVTNVSGTTWTVTRGAESSTPVAHASGFTVQQAVTAGGLGQFVQTAGATMAAWLAPAVVTLTFGTTISINAALGNVFAVTLTASTGTLGTPSNPVDGQPIRVRVIQDSTGGRTLAYSGGWDFGAAGAPALSTAANAVDYLVGEWNASKSAVCVSAALGF